MPRERSRGSLFGFVESFVVIVRKEKRLVLFLQTTQAEYMRLPTLPICAQMPVFGHKRKTGLPKTLYLRHFSGLDK
ncbi:hypothetical protein CL631_02440 [bacterium]|nr:hypothetical protein [bacterium]